MIICVKNTCELTEMGIYELIYVSYSIIRIRCDCRESFSMWLGDMSMIGKKNWWMIGEKNKIHFNMGRNQICYVKKIITKAQLHLI